MRGVKATDKILRISQSLLEITELCKMRYGLTEYTMVHEIIEKYDSRLAAAFNDASAKLGAISTDLAVLYKEALATNGQAASLSAMQRAPKLPKKLREAAAEQAQSSSDLDAIVEVFEKVAALLKKNSAKR